MIYFCCDENRRKLVSQHPTLRGIDFLEVSADQTRLKVHFVPGLGMGARKTVTPHEVQAGNISITGGARIKDITVNTVTASAGILVVAVSDSESSMGVGDFSTYTLTLSGVPDMDPLLSSVDFSFKARCPSDFDCKPACDCPTEPRAEPQLDYLAKDYDTFRQLMLDRMTMLMPLWSETHAADMTVTLVELLAYVADYLSYQQDAVATEAYLGTARRRVSVRRHARLVDYYIDDGCNARVWVQIQVAADLIQSEASGQPCLPKGTPLLSRIPGMPTVVGDSPGLFGQAQAVFETMHDVAALYQTHNVIQFYTWGDARCCIPQGARRATLQGNLPGLNVGDILIFEEVAGPDTGNPADANPSHRHPVRLTQKCSTSYGLTKNSVEALKTAGVKPAILRQLESLIGQMFIAQGDFLNAAGGVIAATELSTIQAVLLKNTASALVDPVTRTEITEIEWDDADALPFPFCLTTVTTPKGDQICTSVARGNIVLADHGHSVTETFDQSGLPVSTLTRVPASAPCRCDDTTAALEHEELTVPPRFYPKLANQQPVTQTGIIKASAGAGSRQSLEYFDPEATAASVFGFETENVLPAITLNGGTWFPQRDLLSSDSSAKVFVVEVEKDGSTCLRFGDDEHGARPDPSDIKTAEYRIGNGTAGNVGAESISHIILNEPGISLVRNPLPAAGGRDPESIEHVRQNAPYAFRTQERAVTEDDYAAIAQRVNPQIQKAQATFRWTGSWHTVFLTADRSGGLDVDEKFVRQLESEVEPYRMAGYDLDVDAPVYVSLDIELMICVDDDYFRSDVEKVLLQVFSNRILPDGTKGMFYPDNFTFGQTVYLSSIYAVAQAVPGVASVQVTTFKRQDTPVTDTSAFDAGKLLLSRLEIARLDNDPNYPDLGIFKLIMGGGK